MKEPQVLQAESRRTDSLWQLRSYELLFLMRIAIDTLVAHLHAVRASWFLLAALRYALLAGLYISIVMPQISPTLTLRCLHIKHPPRLFLCALIRRFRTARLSSLSGESFLVSVGDMLCSILCASPICAIASLREMSTAERLHVARVAGE